MKKSNKKKEHKIDQKKKKKKKRVSIEIFEFFKNFLKKRRGKTSKTQKWRRFYSLLLPFSASLYIPLLFVFFCDKKKINFFLI